MLNDQHASLPPARPPHRPLGVTLFGGMYLWTGLLLSAVFWAQGAAFYEDVGAMHALPPTWGWPLLPLAILLALALATGFLGQRRWGWLLGMSYFSYLAAVSWGTRLLVSPVHPASQRYRIYGPLLLLYLWWVRRVFVR